MATAGTASGLVIQALRYLGKNHMDNKVIGVLKKRLTKKEKHRLMRDFRYAPAWIGAIFEQLQG